MVVLYNYLYMLSFQANDQWERKKSQLGETIGELKETVGDWERKYEAVKELSNQHQQVCR